MFKLTLSLCLLVHVINATNNLNNDQEEMSLLNQNSLHESTENNQFDSKAHNLDEIIAELLSDASENDDNVNNNEKRQVGDKDEGEEEEEKKQNQLFRLELAKKIRTKIMRDFLVNRYF